MHFNLWGSDSPKLASSVTASGGLKISDFQGEDTLVIPRSLLRGRSFGKSSTHGRSVSRGYSVSHAESSGFSYQRGDCQAESETACDTTITGVGRSYSYGGPPHLAQRWFLRQSLADFIDDESAQNESMNEPLIAAARHLLGMLY